MLKKSMLLFGALITTAFILALGTLLKQDLPLGEPPGLWARLEVYLGRNIAQTAVDSPFNELKPVYVKGQLPSLLTIIREACAQLGWVPVRVDLSRRRVDALVTSRWLGFIDELQVQLIPATAGLWRLDIRSAARQGRADFGANERHILDLLVVLPQQGLQLRRTP